MSVYEGQEDEENRLDIRGVLSQSTIEIRALLSHIIPLLLVQIRETWQEILDINLWVV